jgi:transglutaminase-like putative cysteine protease
MSGRGQLTATAALATFAAATGLLNVFADKGWLLPVAGGIAVVAIVSEMSRRTRVAAAIGPLLAAAAVLLYITWLDARHDAYADVVPTGTSLRTLSDLARNGFTDIRSLATPVPTHQGLVLLSVVGLAAIALVVDLIAVTMRRAAVAGLPLLAVFALCTSVSRHGVGWIPFVLASSGYLWLLLTDAKDRVGRWGRTIGRDGPTRVSWSDSETTPSPLSVLGRRVGAASIAIGVVVPLLVPGLHGGLPKHGGNGSGSGGHGSSRVVTLNPIVSIVKDLTTLPTSPLMRMTSTDPAPVYLRLTALDHFDGSSFSPSDLVAPSGSTVKSGIKAPPVNGAGETTTVSVGNLSVHWLPAPTQAESVDVNGDWHYDIPTNTIFSARNTTQDLRYTVSSIRNEPAASDLNTAPAVNPADYSNYLAAPGVQSKVQALASRITAKAKTPFAKAVAIQNYLTSPPFTYSTDVTAGDSATALENFLFNTQTGFCQQYAASMAVLARLVGIPSRVAVGFTRGERQNDGSWLITTRDAHAWPELYLSGFGWIGFEPTPRDDGQTVRPAFTDTTKNPGSDVKPPVTTASPSPRASTFRDQINRLLQDAQGPSRTVPAAKSRHHSSAWWWLLALLAVLVVSPAGARLITRRRRRLLMHDPAQRAGAAWAELRAVAVDAGAQWSEAVTPRTAARMLTTDFAIGEAAAALARLVSAEERARYAPAQSPDAADVEAADKPDSLQLWSCVNAVRRALLAGRGPVARVVTVLMPRSTMLGVHALAGRIADALDEVDQVAARVRRSLRRRSVPVRST